jgi:hypothetical protein
MRYEFVESLSSQTSDQKEECPRDMMEEKLAQLIVNPDKTVRKASMRLVKVIFENGKACTLESAEC